MKKLTAIALLVVLLFNLVGYSIAFRFFESQSDLKLVSRLDRHDYDESDLVQVKIPLHLPYMTSSTEFERVDGTVEADGVHYNYVKRKVDRDTLYILCLKNETKTQLEINKRSYGAVANDFSHQKEEKQSSVKANPVTEFFTNEEVYPDFSSRHTNGASAVNHFGCHLIDAFIEGPLHPPQLF